MQRNARCHAQSALTGQGSRPAEGQPAAGPHPGITLLAPGQMLTVPTVHTRLSSDASSRLQQQQQQQRQQEWPRDEHQWRRALGKAIMGVSCKQCHSLLPDLAASTTSSPASLGGLRVRSAIAQPLQLPHQLGGCSQRVAPGAHGHSAGMALQRQCNKGKALQA